MKYLSDEELMKILQERLKKKKENLDETKRLMEQLWQANKKLEESEAMKSNFLSNIRNEIINPFASILGLTRNIIRFDHNKDPKKVKDLAQLIHYEAFNLNFQLNNIFAAAELEAGESSPQFLRVDIISLVDGVIKSFTHIADKKEMQIKFKNEGLKEKGSFITDPEKLQIILSNLLDNAIKFSNATNEIIINAKLKETILTIEVQDFGAGIDKNDLKIIFDRFKQLNDSINNLNRGHGLGLSVSKALLELLDGKIAIQSQRSHGSTFIVTLPEGEASSFEDDFASEANEFLFGDEQKF